MKVNVGLCAALFALAFSARAAEDGVIADFEGSDFGGWTARGDAFEKPMDRNYPGQWRVEGIEGKQFVNSFREGERSTGTLTSLPFTIERPYISLKVAGGDDEEKTCVELRIDGEVVRRATGKRDEILRWRVWEVADLRGQTAVIRIVDESTAGWGHINVDHIVQEEVSRLLSPDQRVRTLTLDKTYLQFPIHDTQPMVWTTLTVNGKAVHKFQAKWAFDAEPQWWAYLDVAEYAGEEVRIEIEEGERGPWGVEALRQADTLKGDEPLYDETYRPQFHFSQRRGWNNDPNGMVYHQGEWHLYWQYGPFARNWNNMYWGHAVSKDLVHWQELPHAIRPYVQARKNAFSGSAAVDHHNTGGFQSGDEAPIIAAFTDTGLGEVIAYSNDRGRTFTLYEGNPVIRHRGRDPKLFWYEPGRHWVIALYSEIPEAGREKRLQTIAFYTSPDLKTWEKQSHIEGFYECPEIFELPVDGDPEQTRWVVFAADGKYVIGGFDGKTFTPDHEGKHQVHYGNFYAAQCFNDDPKGRVVQIGWARINIRDMPFNQTFTLPIHLTLRTTEKGVRMFAEPVEEIKALRKEPLEVELTELAAGEAETIPLNLDTFEVEMEADADAEFILRFGQETVNYAEGKLNGAPVTTPNGRVRVRLLVDRPMFEVIGNDGECYLTKGRRDQDPVVQALEVRGGAAPVPIHSFKVYPLKSIWKN